MVGGLVVRFRGAFFQGCFFMERVVFFEVMIFFVDDLFLGIGGYWGYSLGFCFEQIILGFFLVLGFQGWIEIFV